MLTVRHRNIIKLHGYCLHKICSFLVYEYMEMGNLFSVLSNDVEIVELEAFVSNFGTIKLLDPNFSSQTLLDGTYGYIVPGEFFFLNYNLFSTYYFKRLAM